ncbi:hypothetical protein JCM24511_02463 [Saitozyma sp. JCM 24511]|nr:hypothetical protein JCM24511_02463 [Saitozyma sp. JCM 24511]
MPPPPLVIHHTSHSPERPLLEPDVRPSSSALGACLGGCPFQTRPQALTSFPPSAPAPALGSSAESTLSTASLVSESIRPSPPPPLTATSSFAPSTSVLTPRPNSAIGSSRGVLSLGLSSSLGSPPGIARVKSFPHAGDLLGAASEASNSSSEISRRASASPVPPTLRSQPGRDTIDTDSDTRMDIDDVSEEGTITVVTRRDPFLQSGIQVERLRAFRERVALVQRDDDRENATTSDSQPATIAPHRLHLHPRAESSTTTSTSISRDTSSSLQRAATFLPDRRTRRGAGTSSGNGDNNDRTSRLSRFDNAWNELGFAPERHRELSAFRPRREFLSESPEDTPRTPLVLSSTPIPSAQPDPASSRNTPVAATGNAPSGIPPVMATRAGSSARPILTPSHASRNLGNQPVASRVPEITGVPRAMAASRTTEDHAPRSRTRGGAWDDLLNPRPDTVASASASTGTSPSASTSFATSTARLRARTRENMPVSYARWLRDDVVVDEPMPLVGTEVEVPVGLGPSTMSTSASHDSSSTAAEPPSPPMPSEILHTYGIFDHPMLSAPLASNPSGSSRTSQPASPQATVPPPRPFSMFAFDTSPNPHLNPNPTLSPPRMRREREASLPVPPGGSAHSHTSMSMREQLRAHAVPYPMPARPASPPTSASGRGHRSTSVGTAFRLRMHRDRLARLDALRSGLDRSEGRPELGLTLASTLAPSAVPEWADRPPLWTNGSRWAARQVDGAATAAAPAADGDASAVSSVSPIERTSAPSRESSTSGGLFDFDSHMEVDAPLPLPAASSSGSGSSSGRSHGGAGMERARRTAMWHRDVQEAVARRLQLDPMADALLDNSHPGRPRERLEAEHGSVSVSDSPASFFTSSALGGNSASHRDLSSGAEVAEGTEATSSSDRADRVDRIDRIRRGLDTGRLWGEIPIDTASSGPHDPMDPFAAYRRGRERPRGGGTGTGTGTGTGITPDSRTHRLLRAFTQPEQRAYPQSSQPNHVYPFRDGDAFGATSPVHPDQPGTGAGAGAGATPANASTATSASANANANASTSTPSHPYFRTGGRNPRDPPAPTPAHGAHGLPPHQDLRYRYEPSGEFNHHYLNHHFLAGAYAALPMPPSERLAAYRAGDADRRAASAISLSGAYARASASLTSSAAASPSTRFSMETDNALAHAMGYMRGGSGSGVGAGAGSRVGHGGSTHWQSAGLALGGVGGVGSGAGLFNTLANLEIREDMPEDEKKAMVKLVIKMVGRLPGVSRQKAAESMVERTNWGAMEVREDMERDTYCSVCHDEYEDDTKIAITPCKHMYHQDCLSTWLSTPNTSSCPMCRRDLAALACLAKLVPTRSREDAFPLWMAAA